MGDPRRIRRKYMRPGHPWQKERIEYETQIRFDYGLKNKSEIWKVSTKLKNFAGQAKKLIAARGTQADREKKQLMDKLASLGLLSPNAHLDDVLSLKLEDLLNRRLQTILVKKGLANTPKQARQFITHQHVTVNGQVVTSPSHLIRVTDENTIGFVGRSSLANEEHPERVAARREPKAEETAEPEAATEPAKKAAKKTAKKKVAKPAAEKKPETAEKKVEPAKKAEPKAEEKPADKESESKPAEKAEPKKEEKPVEKAEEKPAENKE